jgi:hypothetical protein
MPVFKSYKLQTDSLQWLAIPEKPQHLADVKTSGSSTPDFVFLQARQIT